jgi:hypothetical protein
MENQIDLKNKAIEEAFKVAKDFIGKLVNPALEEGGGLIKDNIAYWRFRNQINLSIKAKKFLEDKGISPKKVLPKTLISILENGSLEEDDYMQNKWASLLANASNPNYKEEIKPSYAEILKELSSTEVKLLDEMFEEFNKKLAESEYEIKFNKDNVCKKLNISENEYNILADNLIRLNLCQPVPKRGIYFSSVKKDQPAKIRPKQISYLTLLGYSFVKACKF